MRRKLRDKNVRKVYRKSGSYGITIPMEIVKELGIREGQKVVVKKRGKGILIVDWEG